MGKTAFMFPGQGAQYVGMAASFYEEYKCSREIFEQASEVVGIDLPQLVFSENEKINKTEYTQIALYTTEIAILKAMQEEGYETPKVNIGLSLGEYAALTASGVLDFTDGCKVVRQRGILMEHEVPDGQGSMAAVLGLSAQQVEQEVARINQMLDDMAKNTTNTEHVYIANYNCPGQIVISGGKNAVTYAMPILKDAGAKRVIELNVSGPFHSQMLLGAGEKLGEVLNTIHIRKPQIPYIANYHADYVTDDNAEESAIKELLIKQVYSSVRFEQSVRKMLADGIDTFIEIGPGKTLTGFVKKIAKDMDLSEISLVNIEKTEDMQNG